jgi:hypothetical protein
MRRRPTPLLPTLALAVLVGGPGGAAAAPVQPDVSAYAVLGVAGVRLRPAVHVQSGSVGAASGEARLGAHVTVAGSAVADTVRMGIGAKVSPLFCRLVVGPALGRGVVGGPSVPGAPVPTCEPLVTPLVDPSLLAPVPVTPGTTDVAVPPRTGTSPYPPGSYGAVTVGPGSLLQLAGGDYELRSICIAARGRVVCIAPCHLGVLESVVVRRGAQLGAGAPLRARDARIDVAGSGVAPIVVTGPDAAVAATVFAPAGDVVLGRDGSYRGAVVGRTVLVKPRAALREDSAL